MDAFRMGPTFILAVAMALAMDALAVAVAAGIRLSHADTRQTARAAGFFGLFQALMPIAGWVLGIAARAFAGPWMGWAAFALLALVGARMIGKSFLLADGLSTEPRDSTRGAGLATQGLTAGLDALAIGLSLSLAGAGPWPVLAAGALCLALSAAGLHLGRLFARSARISMLAGRIGGLILVIAGLGVLRMPGGPG